MGSNASSDSGMTQAAFAYPKSSRLATLTGMTTLAERIKMMRETEDLSQEALGKLVGVSRQAIGQWERGETETLTTVRVVALASVFQVSPAWLAFGVGSARGEPQIAPGVDAVLLATIVERVSAMLARRKRTLSPQKFGLLVARIYEYEARRGGHPVDERNVNSLLELTL